MDWSKLSIAESNKIMRKISCSGALFKMNWYHLLDRWEKYSAASSALVRTKQGRIMETEWWLGNHTHAIIASFWLKYNFNYNQEVWACCWWSWAYECFDWLDQWWRQTKDIVFWDMVSCCFRVCLSWSQELWFYKQTTIYHVQGHVFIKSDGGSSWSLTQPNNDHIQDGKI